MIASSSIADAAHPVPANLPAGRGWLGIVLRRGGCQLAMFDGSVRPRPCVWTHVVDVATPDFLADAAFPTALRDMLRRWGTRSLAVLPALGELEFHEFSVPAVSDSERAEIVREELLAVSTVSDLAFGYAPVRWPPPRDTEETQSFRGLAQVWKSGSLDMLAKLFVRQGLVCETVDGWPWLLARLGRLHFPQAPVFTLHMDDRDSAVVFSQQGEPGFVRLMPRLSLRGCLQRLVEEFGLSETSCIEALQRQGVASADHLGTPLASRRLREALLDELAPIIDELARTIDFASRRCRVKSFGGIVAGGLFGTIRGLPEHLRAQLGYEVIPALSGIDVHGGLTGAEAGPAAMLSLLAGEKFP